MTYFIKKILILIPFALAFGAMQAEAVTATNPVFTSVNQQSQGQLLAQHDMSLADRYSIASVNSVFRDNILLTLAYLSGTVKNANQVNWDVLHRPTTYTLILQPGEV